MPQSRPGGNVSRYLQARLERQAAEAGSTAAARNQSAQADGMEQALAEAFEAGQMLVDVTSEAVQEVRQALPRWKRLVHEGLLQAARDRASKLSLEQAKVDTTTADALHREAFPKEAQPWPTVAGVAGSLPGMAAYGVQRRLPLLAVRALRIGLET